MSYMIDAGIECAFSLGSKSESCDKLQGSNQVQTGITFVI
jgi:hypothetical protein